MLARRIVDIRLYYVSGYPALDTHLVASLVIVGLTE
jgi:hypothetical protein